MAVMAGHIGGALSAVHCRYARPCSQCIDVAVSPMILASGRPRTAPATPPRSVPREGGSTRGLVPMVLEFAVLVSNTVARV